jgi:hypothetical protein
MQGILNCFFHPVDGNSREPYGEPHALFDALQVTLSHLLLSPKSQYAHAIQSSRNNYDIVIVYNWGIDYAWGTEVELLYRTFPVSVDSRRLSSRPRRTPRMIPQKQIAACRWELDVNALLHIRNFWHRHLIEAAAGGFGSNDIVEDTYVRMANKMASLGLTPKNWDRELRKDDLNFSGIWHGHYSTLAQWPKRKSDLEELQSLAEDWKHVDPLVRVPPHHTKMHTNFHYQRLDFDIVRDNKERCFWPAIFSGIGAFEESIIESSKGKVVYIRDLANFVGLSALTDKPPPPPTPSLTQGGHPPGNGNSDMPRYHPFLGMRLDGVIHSIAAEPQREQYDIDKENPDLSIPGWSRIVNTSLKPMKDSSRGLQEANFLGLLPLFVAIFAVF